MPTFGSDGGFQADNRGGVIDSQGNTIISADDSFGASPLGVAARTQALYGIPNANFNLTPPDPTAPIVPNQNDLPYWSVVDESGDEITATSVFDATTQTYGVEIDPGTAGADSAFYLTTRSYLLTDDNLALRQKALAVLSKSGTAAGTSQWYLTLDAIYYDANDTALSTAIIGTVFDTGTWTSLAGTTTPGGSAINAAAQYVDLTFTMTTTADVTGSAKATIKSLLLTTSTPSAGGGGFLVSETFTSSTTWTRPTGVDYLVAAIGIGGGGGGGGGGIRTKGTTSEGVAGAGGGGGGAYYIVRDLYVGDQSSISIGIGAGGAGGTAITFSKAAGATTTTQTVGSNGSNGGNTTFGSYFTVKAGSGGEGGGLSPGSDGGAGGSRGGNATTIVYGGTNVQGGVGGNGVKPGIAGGTPGLGGFTNFDLIPYQTPNSASGSGGGIGTATGGSVFYGTALAGGTAGWLSGGGGGGGVNGSTTPTFTDGGVSNKGGGGSGATPLWIRIYATSTVTGTAGNGGNAGANVGAGGGGGSGVALSASGTAVYHPSTITLDSGAGGNGSDGFIAIVYVT